MATTWSLFLTLNACPYFLDPYEYYHGCSDRRECNNGQACLANAICRKCTFGKCIQLAKGKNADGFSHSSEGECRLCTDDELETTIKAPYCGVYKKKGNLNQLIAINSKWQIHIHIMNICRNHDLSFIF